MTNIFSGSNPFSAIAAVAEEKILAAQKAGSFDKLPGAGRPLTFDDDSHIPEELRMAWKILKNSGYTSETPPEETSLCRIMRQTGKTEAENHSKLRRFSVFMSRIRKKQHQEPGGPLTVALENSPYFEKLLRKL